MSVEGICYIVGAGPGDPMLLTQRGLRCLRKADIVFYDRLANSKLLQEAKTDCELISVGKIPGKPGINQQDICALLVNAVRLGKTVVRLKGGDPFLFGRGGEEAIALFQAGLKFEVIPGITAGIAAADCAGIPLTQRGISSAVTFVTGHASGDNDIPDVNWRALGVLDHTLCIYMGVGNMEIICRELVAGGRSPDTPVAIIHNASLPTQSCIVATLGTLYNKAIEEEVKPPSIIIVGKVASLRNSCEWFEKRPFFGKQILILRSENQCTDIIEALEEKGAEVLTYPVIKIDPTPCEVFDFDIIKSGQSLCSSDTSIPKHDPLSHVLLNIAESSKPVWIVFTSANGVNQTWTRLRQLGLDARAFAGSRIAVIGKKTAEALNKYGLVPDLLPQDSSSSALLDAFRNTDKADFSAKEVVLFRSSLAGKSLPNSLREMGYKVEDIVAYCTSIAEESNPHLQEWLKSGRLDAVLFFSGSAAESFRVTAGETLDSFLSSARNTQFIAIGSSAKKTLQKYNLPCDISIPTPNNSDILDGLCNILE